MVAMGAIGLTVLFDAIGTGDAELVLAVVQTTNEASEIFHLEFFILYCLLEVC